MPFLPAWRSSWGETPVANRGNERKGLLFRLCVQLRLQDSPAVLVLTERRRALPAQRIEAHDEAMG